MSKAKKHETSPILDALEPNRRAKGDAEAKARADALVRETLADPRHCRYSLGDVGATIRRHAGLPPLAAPGHWLKQRVAALGLMWGGA